MITYQVFKDNNLIGDGVSIEEARKHLTAGAKIISTVKNKGSSESKDVFKLREGGKVTIIQLPPK